MTTEPLQKLLQAATSDDLRTLVGMLADRDVALCRACLDFLNDRVALSVAEHDFAQSKSALLLWREGEIELDELDECGGDEDAMVQASDRLYELLELLKKIVLTAADREKLLDELIPYIESGNAGLNDTLYSVAYACCKTDGDWRDLAERLEALGQDWPTDHAMGIYRSIGEREKYLALRLPNLRYGGDYYDLASFWWAQGEREKAMQVGRKGLAQGIGRMEELRTFMAERAKESGDRAGFLEIMFAQQTDCLTCASWQAFERECTATEWAGFEPRMLAALGKLNDIEAVKIRLHRGEDEIALKFFNRPQGYFGVNFWLSKELEVARQLEPRYPAEMLSYYKALTGKLDASLTRKEYVQKAEAVLRVRRVLVEVMGQPDEWRRYAASIKQTNAKRPAFQQEFARVIPDWGSL